MENSIYHGIKEKEGKGIIYVGVKKLRKSILLYILDYGVGIPADKLTDIQEQLKNTSVVSSEHIGLTNTNLRLTLAYGEKAVLRLKSVYGNYTLVYFTIPLK